jgi:hypothetical protein
MVFCLRFNIGGSRKNFTRIWKDGRPVMDDFDFPDEDAAAGYNGSCSGRARGFTRKWIARFVCKASVKGRTWRRLILGSQSESVPVTVQTGLNSTPNEWAGSPLFWYRHLPGSREPPVMRGR